MIKIRKRLWLLIGLSFCSAAAIFAAGVTRSQKPQKHIPFTITFSAEDRYDDGRVVQAFTETRFVASTGDWRSIRQLASGATIERVGLVGRGIFTVDAQGQRLLFTAPFPGSFSKPGERYQSNNSVHTATVSGFVTDVVRVEAKGKSVEFYQAPDLNGFVIRQIERHAGFARTIEPTSIVIGEPASQSLKFQEYPEDRSAYQPGGRFTAQAQEEDHLPTADASSPAPGNPGDRAKRKAKNRRYNNSGSRPIEDADYPYQRIVNGRWYEGIPALPAAQSDVVVIGEITDARAFLSEDRTGVYSEFTLRLTDALKNDSSASLYPGAVITINRPGGAVRFPSGHVHKFKTSGQGLPRVNRRYLFFLKRTAEDQDFSIITGYELRGSRVFSLDGSNVEGGGKLPFDDYNGTDSSAFLKTVREAIAQAAQDSTGGRN